MVRARSRPVAVIGRCIYCGRSDTPLTEEHILAAGFGGIDSLVDASCGDCASIINREIEGPCLGKMFREIRYQERVGGRRMHTRPKHANVFEAPPNLKGSMSANFKHADLRPKRLPYAERPIMVHLPITSLPGILRGTPPLAEPKFQMAVYSNNLKRPTSEAESYVQIQPYNHFIFGRFLAKVAHCASVAFYGLGNFEPFLAGVILGHAANESWHYCGMIPDDVPRQTKPLSAYICHNERWKGYIRIDIQILGHLDTPYYSVISGKIDRTSS